MTPELSSRIGRAFTAGAATIAERDILRDDASRRDVLSFADLTLRSQRLLEDLESRGRAA